LYFLLILLAAVQLFPLIWLADFSLMRDGDLFGPGFLRLPNPPQWINYVKAWTAGRIPVYLANSVLIVTVSVLVSGLVSFAAAYACTRMRWKARGLVYSLILLGMTIPIHTTLLPNFIWFNLFGLVNTRLGVIIPYIAFTISFNTLVFSGFMENLPRSVEESAFMDGAGLLRILWSIVAPMCSGAWVTVGVISFLNCWNEFIMANTFIASEKLRTLPFSIINFEGQYSSQYAAQFACMTLIALPPIVLFFVFNRWVMSGVTAGSVKG
jgi:raffinose/stachyose/melibiose transport system permease protein